MTILYFLTFSLVLLYDFTRLKNIFKIFEVTTSLTLLFSGSELVFNRHGSRVTPSRHTLGGERLIRVSAEFSRASEKQSAVPHF
jgi:hypothetical protein